MKKWLQKTLIVAVALLTFGAISPNHEIWTNLQDKDVSKHSVGPSRSEDYSIGLADSVTNDSLEDNSESIEELFITSAKKLSYMKFGTKVGPVIADEFDNVIFPKIEEAIQMTLSSSGDLHKRRLAISEKPAGDYSEKIFNVYDIEDRKDLIRFHVRTEKRPQDGYFYNFHYHIADDNFIAHHSIGDIFWAKNTPPKWLS
ncbi:MAG TPA: YpjP family protein [Sporosarcina psychrophila]|uniref:YpjP family protein n=1 Tax=Sporosarcina psychrophila TaxID=1476 RepID=A0A921FX54_SPOPS|nr:YpjP family protein [Sporosarcina psychrophila]